jgi:hypothetical protein
VLKSFIDGVGTYDRTPHNGVESANLTSLHITNSEKFRANEIRYFVIIINVVAIINVITYGLLPCSHNLLHTQTRLRL